MNAKTPYEFLHAGPWRLRSQLEDFCGFPFQRDALVLEWEDTGTGGDGGRPPARAAVSLASTG